MGRRMYILAWALAGCITCAGRTIKAGRHQPYASVQQAINAALAGDTVWVESGLYREKNIVVNKSLVLLGDKYPVLDGGHAYEIISVKAGHVTIRGFRLVHSGVSSMQDIAGIKIYNGRDIIVSDNILEDTFFGIYVQQGVRCTISNNRLTAAGLTEQQSGNGIHCWKSDSLLITGNTVTGHRDGIYFEFVTHSVVRKNVSYGNIRYGLHFMFSHNDTYTGNVFKNNGAGVSVMFTHGVEMLDNFFEENRGDGAYGLLLKEISDSHIAGNRFGNNTTGIYMEGTSRVRVERNRFTANGWGMKIQASCMDNTITHNNFLSNTFDVGTSGSLVLNNFDYNYWDKYEGYDLNKDRTGDVPYRPVSLYSMIVEKNPPAMILFRSFMASLLDKTEKVLPNLTPENLKDNYPFMKPLRL